MGQGARQQVTVTGPTWAAAWGMETLLQAFPTSDFFASRNDLSEPICAKQLHKYLRSICSIQSKHNTNVCLKKQSNSYQ